MRAVYWLTAITKSAVPKAFFSNSYTQPTYEAFAPAEYIQTNLLPYLTYDIPDEAVPATPTDNEIFTRAAATAPAPAIPDVPAPRRSAPAPEKEQEPRPGKEKTSIFQNKGSFGDDLNYSVIQYARYAARLAAAKEFDVIYCHDWMTFQAGIEIKLGKRSLN